MISSVRRMIRFQRAEDMGFPAAIGRLIDSKWRSTFYILPLLQHYPTMSNITVGVLALQGAFYEHVQLLKQAATTASANDNVSKAQWEFIEVRTPQELARCDALVLPGGESTTMSLVAARSNLLEPLRDFVKYVTRPDSFWPSTNICLSFSMVESTASQLGEPAPA